VEKCRGLRGEEEENLPGGGRRLRAPPVAQRGGGGQGFFFSAEISEILPKTGFTGGHRYFLIPNEIFWISKNMFKFYEF
jgi:hypothetical protein